MNAAALEYIKNLCQIKRNFVESLDKEGLTDLLVGTYEGQATAYQDIVKEISAVQDMLPVKIKPPPQPTKEG